MDFSSLNKPIQLRRHRARPSKYGWVVVFLLIWIPLTALVTANNFLLIVFIMMMGLVGVSHGLARSNISAVTLSRQFPDEIFADTPFSVTYRARTSRKLWGSMALTFKEGPPLKGAAAGTLLSRVPPDETVVSRGLFALPTRGDHRVMEGKLQSSFPFGLAEYSRVCGDSQMVLVFPKIESMDEQIPMYLGGSGRGVEKTDPFGTIPYLLRDYVPGDPYKHIDWKKTAQTGSLITRVFSEEGAREVTIRLPGNASERAISRAASLVVHFATKDTPVWLQGPGINLGPGRGKEFARKLLTILARWQNGSHEITEQDQAPGAVVEIDRLGALSWEERGQELTGGIKRTG